MRQIATMVYPLLAVIPVKGDRMNAPGDVTYRTGKLLMVLAEEVCQTAPLADHVQ